MARSIRRQQEHLGYLPVLRNEGVRRHHSEKPLGSQKVDFSWARFMHCFSRSIVLGAGGKLKARTVERLSFLFDNYDGHPRTACRWRTGSAEPARQSGPRSVRRYRRHPPPASTSACVVAHHGNEEAVYPPAQWLSMDFEEHARCSRTK